MLDRLNKLREERANSDKGFTLIELLVVVVIIGILIAIAIPLYLNYTKGANDKSAASDLRGAISALEQCNSDNGAYPIQATAGAITGAMGAGKTCTQVANTSKNTTINYVSDAAGSGYTVWAWNTSGTGKTQATSRNYCYYSGNGGAVKTEAIAWSAPTAPGTC